MLRRDGAGRLTDVQGTEGQTRPVTLLVPDFVRAVGGVRVRFGVAGERTMALERRESGGYRVRLPRTGDRCEAVLINTGGGMAGGDRMTVEIGLDRDASAVLTTQAAEKIYRSQGDPTVVDIDLRLASGSRLDWLPQETILFSGSRWQRRLSVDMSEHATLTLAESTVFGRGAMNEVMGRGFYLDRWRIRREGRLVFADDVRLDGDLSRHLADKASGGDARALATVLYCAPDAETRLEEARDLLAAARSECGASAWNGMLLMRVLSRDPQALRTDVIGLLTKFRHAPMPRSW